MANYSSSLESGLGKVIEHAKAVLSLCNGSRLTLEETLSEGMHWRNYSKEAFRLFATINAMERAALLLIEETDGIRKTNDACLEVDSNA